jgi:hypothetical protein
MDVLFIAVAATLCKCDEWEEIEEWAIAKEERVCRKVCKISFL